VVAGKLHHRGNRSVKNMIIPSSSPEIQGADYAALTTVNQFRALGLYADYCYQQTSSWSAYRSSLKIRNRDLIDISRVKELLINSWNTERLLRMTSHLLAGPNSGFCAQWAFPQSYYSSFNSTLASFVVSGFTEQSHAAVRKKVSSLARFGTLPNTLNVFVDGGLSEVKIQGISSTFSTFNSARLNVTDFEEVKRHLMSFFRSTRRMHLEDKKLDLKIRTKDGKKLKTTFNRGDWQRVSQNLGKTSWLCLLYRKRIKSNYRDIDTFLSPRFDSEAVLNGLVSFGNVFSLVNEINIINHLGDGVIRGWIPAGTDFVKDRLDFINNETT